MSAIYDVHTKLDKGSWVELEEIYQVYFSSLISLF